MNSDEIIQENNKLKEENSLLKEKLEKYISQHKNYYENNKEIVNEKAKEYRRHAYLKRKDKLKIENI